METNINRGIVLRLAKYLRVLHKLKGLGFVRVFSNNLGDAIGVTPAVVRKDFSTIRVSGNKRGGYNIDQVIDQVETVLGKQTAQQIVVVGCGKIGQALINHDDFVREGIQVVAGFDINPAIINPSASVPILHVDELGVFARANDVQVAVLAVPEQAATQVFERITAAGIAGVLNFSTVDLKCTKCDFQSCSNRCVVPTVNLGLEIENLFYLVRLQRDEVLEDPRATASAERELAAHVSGHVNGHFND